MIAAGVVPASSSSPESSSDSSDVSLESESSLAARAIDAISGI